MVVKNVNGTSKPACKCGNWLTHWRKFGKPSADFVQRQKCSVRVCRNPIEVGVHVQKEVLEGIRTLGSVGDSTWYILPLCETCGQKHGVALVVHDGCGLASSNLGETCGSS